MCAVRIQECSRDIDDLLSSPNKNKARRLCNDRHFCSLKILFFCIFHKLFSIFWIDNNSHPLLRFRDCDLCSIQSGILFRNFVQFDAKTIRQLSDCDGHTACSEIIALFDQTADFFSSEQSLDLSFRGRISLLYLCAAGLYGFLCMNL